MKIHISQTTHELLGADYATAERGEIVVKGKGKKRNILAKVLIPFVLMRM